MSWTDPDVTPVGSGRGGRGPRSAVGLALVLVGVALLAGGIVVAGLGIARAVEANAGIGADAVVRGDVRLEGTPVRFTAAAADHTVYLDFDGVSGNTEVQERAVGATSCDVTTSDGRTTIRGSRQGTSVTLGDYVTVGTFAVAPSPAAIRCAYTRRRAAVLGRPRSVPFVVTPGRPADAIGGIVLILGGVLAALAGGWTAFVGLRRRR